MYVHVFATACTQIGVVGRTGAGKSSLFKAMFRVVELSYGAVFIDGINVANVSLERLRLAYKALWVSSHVRLV